jgi:hypothetical protein
MDAGGSSLHKLKSCSFKPFDENTPCKTLLAFLDDIYEDLELRYPKLRLEAVAYTIKRAVPESL